MPKNQKRPGDVTGRNAEILAEQNKEEQALRAQEMSLMTAAAEEEKSEIVSLGTSRQVETQGAVEVEIPMKTFRVNTTLEDMTYGHGNHYTFEEGRTYKAPKYIYDHLDEKGYVWH